MKALVAIFVSLILLSSGVMVISPAIAIPDNASDKAKVKVPENAVEIAPGIFSLGSVIHHGEVVEGLMVFHHRPGHSGGPPDRGGNGGGNGNGDATCFAFLTNEGLKWKGKKEPWLVNSQNTEGLSSSFILSNLHSNIQQWEDASSSNILGDGSLTTTLLVADLSSPDGLNEVYFADIDPDEAIGVTIIWFISGGPPGNRQLIEWDQVYNQVNFNWSSTGEAGKMDFENISTHELGHSVGLGHPDDSCTEETMFRLASEGETKKRDLNTGDIAGINQLY